MKDLTLERLEAVNPGVGRGDRVWFGVAVAVGCMRGGDVHQWCWTGCGNVITVVVSVFCFSVVCAFCCMRDGRIDQRRMCWGCWWCVVMSSAGVPIDAGHGGVLLRIDGGEILLRVFLRCFEYHSCF